MSNKCEGTTHRFTVETNCNFLLPALDLIPGRRCVCGETVILPLTNIALPEGYYRVGKIDSPQAARFAKLHPAFQTW